MAKEIAERIEPAEGSSKPTLEAGERIKLSTRDSQAFVQALLEPTLVNER